MGFPHLYCIVYPRVTKKIQPLIYSLEAILKPNNGIIFCHDACWYCRHSYGANIFARTWWHHLQEEHLQEVSLASLTCPMIFSDIPWQHQSQFRSKGKTYRSNPLMLGALTLHPCLSQAAHCSEAVGLKVSCNAFDNQRSKWLKFPLIQWKRLGIIHSLQ